MVSLPAVIYSIVFLSVAKQYGLDDVCAMVAYSGRDTNLLKTLGAATVRFFLMRLKLDRSDTVRALARKMQSTLMRGAISSRPPFTYTRAQTQLEEGEAVTGADHDQAATATRAHLAVIDASRIQASLRCTTPGLHVERVLPGPLLRERFELAMPTPAPATDDGPLNILIRRDLGPESDRAITFLGVFNIADLADDVADAFMQTVAQTAERFGRIQQDGAIGRLLED